eukprot:4712160-Ditylum_brightwellii.AAC.1
MTNEVLLDNRLTVSQGRREIFAKHLARYNLPDLSEILGETKLAAELKAKDQLNQKQAQMLKAKDKQLMEKDEHLMILEKENNLVQADQNGSAREKEFEFKTIPILNATDIKISKGGQIRPYNSVVNTRCEGKQEQYKKEDCKKSVVIVSTVENRHVNKSGRACGRHEV